MARDYKIRWRNKDNVTIRRAVKNYNAKVRRLEKKFKDKPHLIPERVKVRDLRKQIKTREDFNVVLKNLKSLTKRESEQIVTNTHGVETTKFQIEVAKRNVRRANVLKRRERERAKINLPKKGRLGLIEEHDFTPEKFDFNKSKRQDDFKGFTERLRQRALTSIRDERLEQYKENYITALRRALGSHANSIIEKIKNVSADRLLDSKYLDERYSVDFVYDPQDALFLAMIIEQAWNELLN